MPSGFRIEGAVGFFGCDGPDVEEGSGMEKMLRTSAAEVANAMMFESEAQVTCDAYGALRVCRLGVTWLFCLDYHGRVCKCVFKQGG